MKYQLGRPLSTYTVRAIHADGRPWPDWLCYTSRGMRLQEPTAKRPATRFLTRQKAMLAWETCADVYADTLPDIQEHR
jgi:hypothetical protein